MRRSKDKKNKEFKWRACADFCDYSCANQFLMSPKSAAGKNSRERYLHCELSDDLKTPMPFIIYIWHLQTYAGTHYCIYESMEIFLQWLMPDFMHSNVCTILTTWWWQKFTIYFYHYDMMLYNIYHLYEQYTYIHLINVIYRVQ